MQIVKITDAARHLLLEHGYAGTTTDEIAARCEISKQTLYRLFPDKLSIFASVIDAHRQSMLALPGDYDDLPTDQALGKIFKIDINAQADRERLALLQVAVNESQQFPELADVIDKHGGEPSRAALSRWLADRKKRGLIRIADTDRAAVILMDMIFGPLLLKLAHRVDLRDHKDVATHVRTCIGIFLNGVTPRS